MIITFLLLSFTGVFLFLLPFGRPIVYFFLEVLFFVTFTNSPDVPYFTPNQILFFYFTIYAMSEEGSKNLATYYSFSLFFDISKPLQFLLLIFSEFENWKMDKPRNLGIRKRNSTRNCTSGGQTKAV